MIKTCDGDEMSRISPGRPLKQVHLLSQVTQQGREELGFLACFSRFVECVAGFRFHHWFVPIHPFEINDTHCFRFRFWLFDFPHHQRHYFPLSYTLLRLSSTPCLPEWLLILSHGVMRYAKSLIPLSLPQC